MCVLNLPSDVLGEVHAECSANEVRNQLPDFPTLDDQPSNRVVGSILFETLLDDPGQVWSESLLRSAREFARMEFPNRRAQMVVRPELETMLEDREPARVQVVEVDYDPMPGFDFQEAMAGAAETLMALMRALRVPPQGRPVMILGDCGHQPGLPMDRGEFLARPLREQAERMEAGLEPTYYYSLYSNLTGVEVDLKTITPTEEEKEVLRGIAKHLKENEEATLDVQYWKGGDNCYCLGGWAVRLNVGDSCSGDRVYWMTNAVKLLPNCLPMFFSTNEQIMEFLSMYEG